jgi:hypothetical protein
VKGSLKRLARHRFWLTSALVTVIVAFAGVAVVVFYPLRPAVELRYDRIASDVLLFHAENHGALPILLDIEKFEVSTLKFGKIGYDRFDVRFAKNSIVVAGNESTSIAIPTPTGTQPYLCSQLRSIGFFLDYGPLRSGRLPERFSAERTKQIASDLGCSFSISEAGAAAKNTAKYEIRLACDKVPWISDCVATVLSSAN